MDRPFPAVDQLHSSPLPAGCGRVAGNAGPALFRLDEILHIQSAPAKPLVQNFYRTRLENAIAEIEQTQVTEGMRIWRLYNHGALVRTPSVSFTFDIVPGTRTPGFALAPEVLERLVAQSDVTFISHLHGDHANADVARMFLAAGKPVIAPKDCGRTMLSCRSS